MNESIWNIEMKRFPQLTVDKHVDVCIVGGGLTGVSLAYYLKDTKQTVCLIEQNLLGGSTTGRSTAKLTYLQQDLLSKIKKCYGKKKAREYYQAQRDAIGEVIRIIQKEKIACHLEESPSYLFVQEDKNVLKLKREYALYKEFNAPVCWMERMPKDCGEKLCFMGKDTYVFHPLEYLRGLVSVIESSKNIQIYENTRMVRYLKHSNEYSVCLQNGSVIYAKRVVFAGSYPPFILPYLFPMKAYLEKDFVQYKDGKHYSFNAINLDSKIFSIRFFENKEIRVVLSNRLGNRSILKNPFRENDDSGYFSNYDVMTRGSLPMVGWIGSSSNGLYLATGFNTWGMTNSNLAAQIIAMELLGKKHPYASLFSPYPAWTFVFLAQTFLDTIVNIYRFVVSYFPNRSRAQIGFKNGQRVGRVVDSNGVIHEVCLTCPHMKCGLRYNPTEQTWDCPCHGSRFDLDGNLVRGPATSCVQKRDAK